MTKHQKKKEERKTNDNVFIYFQKFYVTLHMRFQSGQECVSVTNRSTRFHFGTLCLLLSRE